MVWIPRDTSQSAMRCRSPVKAWKVCTGSSHKSGNTAATWNREPMSIAAALPLMIGKPAVLS